MNERRKRERKKEMNGIKEGFLFWILISFQERVDESLFEFFLFLLTQLTFQYRNASYINLGELR